MPVNRCDFLELAESFNCEFKEKNSGKFAITFDNLDSLDNYLDAICDMVRDDIADCAHIDLNSGGEFRHS